MTVSCLETSLPCQKYAILRIINFFTAKNEEWLSIWHEIIYNYNNEQTINGNIIEIAFVYLTAKSPATAAI